MNTRTSLLFAVALHAISCMATADGVAFFEREIRPALITHCYECHSVESKVKGGLRLDSRSGIEAGGDHGPVLIKGQPESSLLIEAIRYQNRDLQMPPKNPLPPATIAKFEQWIAMGAPDPRTHSPTAAPTPDGMTIDDGRQFWSFRSVTQPPVPKLSSPFVRNPIDAFILHALEQRDLIPAPKATKTTLLRRATQNLIGLPPTPAEIEAFLADESPNAFNRVIDRLLNSPQYGIRWGRHWLDVARYADSNGLDENIGFGNAWRYRDYVVQAFNTDKPYDQFLIEQLAGDLLPEATHESITATGFLQLGPKVLAEPDVEKLHLDVIDEQLDTMGKAFLGMTLGCARCHDHKFDPLKQTDYYSLAAIFKGTRTFGGENMGAIKFWYEHPISTPKDQAAIKQIDEQLKALNAAASSFKNRKLENLRSQARARATDYLVACTEFDPNAPLTKILEIATPKSLHPRILHHCRIHLEYHRDDPFFNDWHIFANNDEIDKLQTHYRRIFEAVENALTQAKEKKQKTVPLSDDNLEVARAALYDKSGFLAVPTVDTLAFDRETLEEYYQLLTKARAFESNAPDIPALMGVSDGEAVDVMPVLIRGDRKSPGKTVPRAFPEVMRWNGETTEFAPGTSGRYELAQWMGDPRHPLTARVMVNRLWGWHFGQGLVASTENFGTTGTPPSHPLLLDWLATYFMESGWSIKAVNRLILRTSTWQMASQHPNEASYATVDPTNRFLWKQNLRRMEAEQLRDSILAVASRLDRTLGGKTLPLRNRQFVFNHTSEDHTTYESLRRAIYLPVIRNNLYPLFEQFDFPDPTMPTGRRQETVIAPQALVLLNDPLIMDSTDAMAAEIVSHHENGTDRLREVYLRIFGRHPHADEIRHGAAFISQLANDTPERQAWSLYCQAMLASNGFLYLK